MMSDPEQMTDMNTKKEEAENEKVQKEQLLGKQEPEIPTATTFNIQDAKITDKSLIAKYDKEFDYNFFMPDQEEETFDTEELTEQNYLKSSEKIGGQIYAIAVVVCPADPTMKQESQTYNPESIFRIHGRIADGRHRYLETKSEGKQWKTDYYVCKTFEDFMQLRAHMDSKKKQTKDEMRNRFTQIAEYKFKVLGIPREKICALLIEEYCPPHAQSSIRYWLPDEYKDSSFADRRLGKTKDITETKAGKIVAEKVEKKSKRQLSKKDKKIEELHQKINADIIEISTLQDTTKIFEEKVKEYDDLKPFLAEKHQTTIEGTDIKVLVELDTKNKNVKVTKI